jgi:hypothetical protein
MADDFKFITTRELLSQIGEGIGQAHENLIKHSKPGSEIGVLAVKNAEVTVTFELTSSATTNTDTLGLPSPFPVSGAKTFSFTSKDENNTLINKAKVVLNIVNIMPSAETGQGKLPGNTKAGGNVSVSGAEKYKDIIAKLELAASQLPAMHLGDAEKKQAKKKIDVAIELFKKNKEAQAKEILKELSGYLNP